MNRNGVEMMAYILTKSADEGDEIMVLRGMLCVANECDNFHLVGILNKAIKEMES